MREKENKQKHLEVLKLEISGVLKEFNKATLRGLGHFYIGRAIDSSSYLIGVGWTDLNKETCKIEITVNSESTTYRAGQCSKRTYLSADRSLPEKIEESLIQDFFLGLCVYILGDEKPRY